MFLPRSLCIIHLNGFHKTIPRRHLVSIRFFKSLCLFELLRRAVRPQAQRTNHAFDYKGVYNLITIQLYDTMQCQHQSYSRTCEGSRVALRMVAVSSVQSIMTTPNPHPRSRAICATECLMLIIHNKSLMDQQQRKWTTLHNTCYRPQSQLVKPSCQSETL